MNDDQSTSTHGEKLADKTVRREASEVHELSGQLISGRYQVEECLGRGAMGEVYRATHTLMAKTVAIKVLRPQLDQRDDLVERFRREAQAAAHIDHPNICSASDFGQTEDGTFFLVIEYLEGRTLEDLIEAQAPLDVDSALDIALQIASALSRAHELDVVHRDLKPENIMLVAREDAGEMVKILDFGVARVRLTAQHENAQLTQAGTVWGTPTYMSPEQAAGAEVDGRSDLYSLGIILYEMLSGQPPFVDSHPGRVMAMHLTQTPAPLSQRVPGTRIPRALEDLILELLAKDPGDRPASAAALAARLKACRTAPEHKQPGIAQHTRDVAGQSSVLLKRAVSSAQPLLSRTLQWFRAQQLLAQGAIVGLIAAILLGMAVLPVVLIVSVMGGPASDVQRKEIERDLEKEREQFLEAAGLSDVPIALAEGRTSDALAALDNVPARFADSPHIGYLTGWVNGARGRWQGSIEGYAQALAGESLYANDTRLTDHIFERFADRSDQRAADAKKLIETYLNTVYATEKLADLAKNGSSSAVRKRAFNVLNETGRIKDLEKSSRLSVEMAHAEGCVEYKSIIAEIVAAGDPRGLEVLKEYSQKGRTGCGFLSLKDCYGCIRDDLRQGIKKLEEKSP